MACFASYHRKDLMQLAMRSTVLSFSSCKVLSMTLHSQSSVLDWDELIEKKIWRMLLVSEEEPIGLATQMAFLQKENPLTPF